jgi:hypothetical protein
MLSFDPVTSRMRSANLEQARWSIGAGDPFFADTYARCISGNGRPDGAQMGLDWSLVAGLLLPPDRNKGTVLAYVIASDGRVVHRRNFGDSTDESEVIAAEVSRGGMLNLRVFFPSLKQTREYGLLMQPDGTIRAMYNRSQKGEYSIRDGKFTANGNPTPPQHKCGANVARANLAE